MKFAFWMGGLGMALIGIGQTIAEDTAVASVIAELQRHELLYERLHVRLRLEYTDLRPGMAGSTFVAGGSTGKIIGSSDQRIQQVFQDGLFRLDVTSTATYGEADKDRRMVRLRMFDGSTTRYRQDNVANVIDGVQLDPGAIRPFTLFVAGADCMSPLSVYLSGEDAMSGYPGQKWDPDDAIEVVSQGTATVGQEYCHKLQLQKVDRISRRPRIGYLFWLAIHKNYIPVRVESFTYRWSPTLPVAVGEVTDWTEIEPGIWFPKQAEATRFSDIRLQRDKTSVPVWRKKWSIEHAELDVDYPIEFFQDWDLPKGTAVYEIGTDKKIKRSYHLGAETPPAPSTPPELPIATSRLWHILLLIVNGIGVVMAWMWVRRSGRFLP
jgi:hypothetical protein